MVILLSGMLSTVVSETLEEALRKISLCDVGYGLGMNATKTDPISEFHFSFLSEKGCHKATQAGE